MRGEMGMGDCGEEGRKGEEDEGMGIGGEERG